jgi:uncharacterized glyoxalase superfamily protein PhnB
MQTIFPILRYNDARAAIQSLCSSFGFVELFSVPQSGEFVRHAQLKLETKIVMLGFRSHSLDHENPIVKALPVGRRV